MTGIRVSLQLPAVTGIAHAQVSKRPPESLHQSPTGTGATRHMEELVKNTPQPLLLLPSVLPTLSFLFPKRTLCSVLSNFFVMNFPRRDRKNQGCRSKGEVPAVMYSKQNRKVGIQPEVRTALLPTSSHPTT